MNYQIINHLLRYGKDYTHKRIRAQGLSGLLDLHDNWLSSVMSCLTGEEQRRFENYCCRLLAAAKKMETLQQTKADK